MGLVDCRCAQKRAKTGGLTTSDSSTPARDGVSFHWRHPSILVSTGKMQPSFATLWANHPNIKGDGALLDKDVYKDQCAINVGAAFIRSSMNLDTFRGVYSWQKDKPKYPIRAQELASWLDSGTAGLMSRTEKYTGKEGFDKIAGRAGIVFIQNYWGEGRQGDHIDLWNGSRLTKLSSWFLIQWRISWEGVLTDMRHAQAIWFWPVL